jgi:hypothetical protein
MTPQQWAFLLAPSAILQRPQSDVRYFGTAFIMPMEGFRESVTNFEGNLLMRAFGLINTASYHKHLRVLYGEQVFCWINAVRHRFWFAAGYEQLKECEPPLFAERSLYLPIGLSPAFWKNANTWKGTERRLLFFCPSIVKNPYHAAVYRQFKREFGDFPHLIAGKQDNPPPRLSSPSLALPFQNVTIVRSVLASYSCASSH